MSCCCCCCYIACCYCCIAGCCNTGSVVVVAVDSPQHIIAICQDPSLQPTSVFVLMSQAPFRPKDICLHSPPILVRQWLYSFLQSACPEGGPDGCIEKASVSVCPLFPHLGFCNDDGEQERRTQALPLHQVPTQGATGVLQCLDYLLVHPKLCAPCPGHFLLGCGSFVWAWSQSVVSALSGRGQHPVLWDLLWILGSREGWENMDHCSWSERRLQSLFPQLQVSTSLPGSAC